MNSKTFRLAAFALLFSTTVFSQSVTVAPANGKGNSFENAIAVPLETVINFNSNKLEKVYFTFDAPFNAKYHIQNAEESGAHATFCLYSSKKKRMDKNTVIVEELDAGSYTIEVISRNARADVKMSIIVTLNTLNSFDTPQKIKERQAEIAKATVTPLSQNIGFDITENRDPKWYRFQVTDAARYQFSVKCSQNDAKYPPNFNLYNDKYRSLMYSNEPEGMLALLPGVYYLKLVLGSAKAGNNVSVVYTKEDEAGWDFEDSSWLAKFERKNRGLYLALLAISGVLITVILLLAFRPYTKYLKEEHDITFFGLPFFIMLAVLTAVFCLENFTNSITVPMEYVVVIGSDILITAWMCISHYRKSQSIFHTVVSAILIQIAYVVAFAFMLFAFLLALVILFIIFCFLLFAGSTSLAGSVGFGSNSGVGGSGNEPCLSCGGRKRSGQPCPHCGVH